jgi:tetratricopeptide (TPR) repeat protein
MIWPDDWRLPSPRTLLTAGLGVLVVILVAGGVWFWMSSQSERAQAIHAEALSQAQAVQSPQTPPAAKAGAISALESAIAQAPGAALAAQSAYELANIRFDTGQFEAARAAYEIARGRAESGTIRTLAQAGIAATWEAERNFAKAIDAYGAALNGRKPGEFCYEDLLTGLGRSQELAGRKDDAIATYKRLLKDVPKLRRGDEIRGRLASLGVSG